MSRSFAVVMALVVAHLFVLGGAAAESGCREIKDERGEIIEIVCSGDDRRERRGPGGGGGAVPEAPDPQDVTYRPVLDDGCIRFEREVFDGAAYSQLALEYERQTLEWIDEGIPFCEGQAGTPDMAPEVLALQVWSRAPVPTMLPEIKPGRAIVGKYAYLETNASMTFTHAEPSALGLVEITATSVIYVDWGDGTITGPYEEPGAPYPNGTITYAYSRSGVYTVVVTQEWTADWRIGDRTGSIGPAPRTETLPDFPVNQLQAVRNR